MDCPYLPNSCDKASENDLVGMGSVVCFYYGVRASMDTVGGCFHFGGPHSPSQPRVLCLTRENKPWRKVAADEPPVVCRARKAH